MLTIARIKVDVIASLEYPMIDKIDKANDDNKSMADA